MPVGAAKMDSCWEHSMLWVGGGGVGGRLDDDFLQILGTRSSSRSCTLRCWRRLFDPCVASRNRAWIFRQVLGDGGPHARVGLFDEVNYFGRW